MVFLIVDSRVGGAIPANAKRRAKKADISGEFPISCPK